MKDIRLSFGERVRALRKAAGLSQEKMAALVDIDRTYIADIEGGKRNVSIMTIDKIARGLGISMSQLIEGVDEVDN